MIGVKRVKGVTVVTGLMVVTVVNATYVSRVTESGLKSVVPVCFAGEEG